LVHQNDTQLSGPFLYPSATARKERTWSMVVPRNVIDADVSTNPDIFDTDNWDNTQTFKERMRDKYMTCEFSYYNENTNVFSVPFISTVYRKSVR